jgi:hypothetical protein
VDGTPKGVTVLRNGTYFGECLVDCNEEIAVTPEKVTYSLTSNVPDADHPDIHAEGPVTRSEWEQLTGAIDSEALRSLPETIGQPDATDAGGEFLEVSDGARMRVDFDLDATIPEVAPLLDALRGLRARLARQHRR